MLVILPFFPPPSPPPPATFRHVLLTVHLYQPIYLPGWTEALWEYIALSKNRPDKVSNPDLSTRSQPHSLVDHYYFEKKQMKITLTDFCRSLKPFFFWTNCPYKWGGKKASFNTSLLQRDNVNFLWWQRLISLSSPWKRCDLDPFPLPRLQAINRKWPGLAWTRTQTSRFKTGMLKNNQPLKSSSEMITFCLISLDTCCRRSFWRRTSVTLPAILRPSVHTLYCIPST